MGSPDRQPTLQGRLITLRPLKRDDWPALFAVAADPEIWAVHPASDRWREDVFGSFFEEAIASGGALAVLDGPAGRVIGSSRYGPYDAKRQRIEIGWTFLARAYWGGAYNREMKRLMLAHVLPHVKSVNFVVGVTNLRSRRALEKIGARLCDEEQVRRMAGREVPHVVYELDKVPPA